MISKGLKRKCPNTFYLPENKRFKLNNDSAKESADEIKALSSNARLDEELSSYQDSSDDKLPSYQDSSDENDSYH